jgi:quercetin dioxygenase-like cupin family protein
MNGHALRLWEDALGPGSAYELPPAARVLYVRAGAVTVRGPGGATGVKADAAWHAASACEVAAGTAGAALLRWELARGGAGAGVGTGATSRLLLEHAIALDPAAPYLMRCDRVDFAPGGVALPHRHRGGGIRCLLAGTLDVSVGGEPARRMTPGSAWFESGREPVLAVAAPDAPTSFIRVSILPRELLGKSSIVYVDPADAARGRPRKYTVHVDAPIDTA